jgi:tRNA(Ile)-lysidine synthase
VRIARARLTGFARHLLNAWRTLQLPAEPMTLIVAVSGGADSTALLLALNELVKTNELALRLTVAHLDHKLRKHSSEDARWVASLAGQLGCRTELGRANVKQRAKAATDNLEQAARRARYEFLAKTAVKNNAPLVLTAHTMDDQAETVLLRLLRGSGADGLAGIEPLRPLDPESNILLARPLITWARRNDTESYCRQHQIAFRLDEMNDNEQFARVRVRKQLLPLMQSFNGRVVEALCRTAALLRDDANVLNRSADSLLQMAYDGAATNKTETDAPALSVNVLARAAAAVRRRALRRWVAQARGDLRRLEMVHLLGVEKLLEGNRGGRTAELPGGGRVMRRKGRLELKIKRD